MDVLSLLEHVASFTMPAVFVGIVLGTYARWQWYPHRSWVVLSLSGALGGIIGLGAGWALTGQDGHMLAYGLLAVLAAAGVAAVGRG